MTNWMVAMANLAVFPAFAGPAEMMRLLGILVRIKQGLQPLSKYRSSGTQQHEQYKRHEPRGGDRCLDDPHMQGCAAATLEPPTPTSQNDQDAVSRRLVREPMAEGL